MSDIQDLPALRLCVIQAKAAPFTGRRLHSHPFHELGVVLRGSCVWNQKNGRAIPVSAGQAIWIPPENLHREESELPAQLAWVGFNLKHSPPVKPLRPVSLDENFEAVLFLLRQIASEQHQADQDSPEISPLALRHIFLLLGRASRRRPSLASAGLLNPRQVQIVRSVAAHLDQNRARPLSLDQVAQYYNLSAPHLSMLFRKHYRMTPTSYRLQGRLAHAKELLADLTLSVKQIASSCGFTDAAHFCREFKRLTGQTPGLTR